MSGQASFARCSPSFISPITPLLGNRGSSLLAPGITIVANCPLQLHRQIFFTECILTGSSASCRLPPVLHPGSQLPPARSAPTFSYQSHFDWQPVDFVGFKGL